MARSRVLVVVILAVTAAADAQPARKKLLAVGRSAGYAHNSVSHGLATIWKLGQETRLWDTFISTDTELITKKKLDSNRKNLDYFDGIIFYTTGELELNDEQKAAFLSFIRDDGKGFLGTHSATDTLYNWPEYGELIGGYFNEHPWSQLVGVNVEDRSFAATRHFPPRFEIIDEIYQFKNWSRDRVHVLMSIDTSTVDLTKTSVHRTDKDFAVAWTRAYGKGRVFYCSLGHREDVWNRPDIQKMWIEAIKWSLGIAK